MDEHGKDPQKRSEPVLQMPDDGDDRNLKERLYDHIHIPVRVLDVIIVLLILATLGVIVLGTLKGRGIV